MTKLDICISLGVCIIFAALFTAIRYNKHLENKGK